jgi:2-polyprenyl-3-methyl-5-hydroxy-6-metoxy-1,4-benzoquinol methylase
MLKTWTDHYWASVPIVRNRIEEVVRTVNGRDKTVLEVGCNEGFLSKALQEDGCIVTSADIDQRQIDRAKEMFGIQAIQADVTCLPFPEGSFDIVVAGELLEHVFNPFQGLSELFRVAKEKVVITLPIGEYWLGETTHQWMLEGTCIEHDKGPVLAMPAETRHVLVLTWVRKRNHACQDIAPFNTDAVRVKYAMP